MKIKALSLSALIALAGLSCELSAEERADVLERIAPIGKVNLEGEAQPAAAPAAAAEPSAAAAPAPVAEPSAAAAPAPAAADSAELALATQSGCMNCHKMETKLIGPAYKDVAAKYKGDAAALEMLVSKVTKGGQGTWGVIPMPPNSHIPEQDIRTIVTWLLEQ